ncbi:hypothetical protein PQ786_11180 [Alcaligenes faecalis]
MSIYLSENFFILYLPLIVFFYSVFQSLIGVGLLLFGTPTLLLLGMDFGEALTVLLPCSITINLCQLCNGLPRNRKSIYRIMGVTLPMIFVGLVFSLQDLDTYWISIIVGITLVALGVIRISIKASSWLNHMVASYQIPYLAFMGLLHGLSNLGGGLLVAYASTLASEKNEIRSIVALGYFLFAATQLIVLFFSQPHFFKIQYFYLPFVSLFAYLGGNYLFSRLNSIQFGKLVTFLILFYGLVTIGNVFG